MMMLKMHGSLTAAALGKKLGTTGEAARQQLSRLADEGLVVASSTPSVAANSMKPAGSPSYHGGLCGSGGGDGGGGGDDGGGGDGGGGAGGGGEGGGGVGGGEGGGGEGGGGDGGGGDGGGGEGGGDGGGDVPACSGAALVPTRSARMSLFRPAGTSTIRLAHSSSATSWMIRR